MSSSLDTRLRLFGPLFLFFVGTLFFRLNTLVDFNYTDLYRYDLVGILAGYVNWHIARWVLLRLQKRYPGIDRTRRRFTIYGLLLPLLLTNATLLRTEPLYWLGLDPSANEPFSWFDLNTAGSTYFRQYVLTAGIQLFHHCVYLGIYEGIYLFGQWQRLYMEKERLLKAEWQARFDAMSSQVNPHFLFNALNSLSALISEDPAQAEAFVDKLSGVYRYVLRANRSDGPRIDGPRIDGPRIDGPRIDGPSTDGPSTDQYAGPGQHLTTLEAELQFIEAYYHLLKTRYGDGLTLTVDVDVAHRSSQLPPLTLQLLVENAVKHNVVSPKRPLHIQITSTKQDGLLVSNTLQRKQSRPGEARVLSNGIGLNNIISKYQLLNLPGPVIGETGEHFTVILPLLVESTA